MSGSLSLSKAFAGLLRRNLTAVRGLSVVQRPQVRRMAGAAAIPPGGGSHQVTGLEESPADQAQEAVEDGDGEAGNYSHQNSSTGELGGPRGPEPTRYGDWEQKGRCTDF